MKAHAGVGYAVGGGAGGAGIPVRYLVCCALFLGLCVLPLAQLVLTGSAYRRASDGGRGVAAEAGAGAGGKAAASHRAPVFRRDGAGGALLPVVPPPGAAGGGDGIDAGPTDGGGSSGGGGSDASERTGTGTGKHGDVPAASPLAPAARPPPPPPPSRSPPPPPALQPRFPKKETRSYVASIVGPWFGGVHHWANGQRTCPSGCTITFVHDAPDASVDAFLFHGGKNDVGQWVYRRDNLAQSAATKDKLRLFYAAENFPSVFDAGVLTNFNGEASYRLRSIAREVQYPLEVVARFTSVGEDTLGAAVTEAGSPTPGYMQRCWNDVAPAIVPWEQRTSLPDATISWASNHCTSTSGREAYIEDLVRHIPIEIYTAPCLANAPPAKAALSWQEQWELWRSYKFYLAFENSRCNDYVTEKFYLALARGQVPVVLGAANIADHAPSRDSYIDVRDFDSPAALAAHLRYLDANPAEYAAYHAWRARPFETYGAAFRDVLLGALPVAQRDGAKAGHASGNMFACSVCTALAAWEDAGRRLDGNVTPFVCEPPIAPADGRWK